MKTAPERLRIDVHGHYFPTPYLDMLDRFGGPGTGTGSDRAVPADGSDEELASRFAMMDRAGIDIQILSAAPQLPYFKTRSGPSVRPASSTTPKPRSSHAIPIGLRRTR